MVNVWPSNVAKKQGEHRLGTVFVYVLMRRNTGNTALVPFMILNGLNCKTEESFPTASSSSNHTLFTSLYFDHKHKMLKLILWIKVNSKQPHKAEPGPQYIIRGSTVCGIESKHL